MIKVELWGVVKKEYGPVFELKTTITNYTLKDVYLMIISEEALQDEICGWIKIFINERYIPTTAFLERYRRTHPESLQLYVTEDGKFALLDPITKVWVFEGGLDEVEKYLEEHGL
jgi:hypothetical protein